MRTRWALVFVAASGFAWPATGGEPKGDAAGLKRLVDRLGSRSFREREAATTALMASHNPAAVELLHKVADGSGDLEVRRRARRLLEHLESILDTKRILRPQRLRLSYKEVPVAEAVADFARRSGLPVILQDADRNKLQGRKVTLETGEVSAWEGLGLLCEKAGLAEKAPEVKPTGGSAVPFNDLKRGQVIWLDGRHGPTRADRKIVLADGTAKWPTYCAGALRIRALTGPVPGGKGSPKSVAREVGITLDVDVEPRFGWDRIVSVRVDRGVDSQGQRLWQPEVYVGEQGPWNPYALSGEVIVVWDGVSEMPMSRSRQAPIRLRLGERPAKTIRELHGTLSAEVEAPAGPLVTVDNLLKSAGKTVRGLSDSSVKVLEVKREPSGQYQLKLEVKAPARATDFPQLPNVRVLRLNQKRWGGGLEVRQNLSAQDAANWGLAVFDAKGRLLPLASGEYRPGDDPRAGKVYTLFVEPGKDRSEPARFVFTGRRRVLLEVPFVLKDVPLP
jgi:hypothetical protein